MLDKIEALRKEPTHVRNRYAFWTAFIVTMIIAVVWGISLPTRIAQQQLPAEEEAEVIEDVSRLGSFLSNAGDRFKEIIMSFRSTQAVNPTATSTREEIDFAELIASSTERKRAEEYASSTASSTATTTASTTPEYDSASTTRAE